MEFIDLQWSEDMMSRFLTYYILNFYINRVLPSQQFSDFISHTQQGMSMFAATYCWEQLFSKIKHAKSMLHWQLSNHHLSDGLLSTTSFNTDVRCLYDLLMRHLISAITIIALRIEVFVLFYWMGVLLKIVVDSFLLMFCSSQTEKIEDSWSRKFKPESSLWRLFIFFIN